MPDHSSVSSTGGLGTNFEQHIQAAFLIGLLTGGAPPCIADAQITALYFQTTDLGYSTDDLLVETQSRLGQQHRLLLQIKHNLTLSAAEDNEFEKVMRQFWQDYQAADRFDPNRDRLVIVKGGLNDGERNHIKIVLNWARFNASSATFFLEVRKSQQKKDRVELFRTVLARVSHQTITDDELWRFLRCVELLDYDLKSTGSVDEAFLLQLINLAIPNPDVVAPLTVWQEAVTEATEFDNNGGSVEITSLPDRPFYHRFTQTRLRPVMQAVQRLIGDNQIVTRRLRNRVGNVTLPRQDDKAAVLQALGQHQVVIVTGGAGVGKSALMRDVLDQYVTGNGYWAFRAEQFSVPHLGQVFALQGVSEPLPALLAAWALLPQKVLYIDSAEKLLEGPPDDAFHQLLAQVATLGKVTLILTARQHAVELLIHRYQLDDSACITVPSLTDEDLANLSQQVPRLDQLLHNEKLRELLRSLKYLDLAIKLLSKTPDDLSAASRTEFKNELWKYVVEDAPNQQDALHWKRGRAFESIALRRARQLALFVGADAQDDRALLALVHDDLLFQDEAETGFAPTHDVLEDLALVRFIRGHWNPALGVAAFFTAIGSSPALRRSFRLWVEEVAMEEPAQVVALIGQVLDQNTLEKYWLDESLIAVLRSTNAEVFFTSFEQALLDEDAKFLARCLRLMHTACTQRTYSASEESGVLVPVGSGWAAALDFCARHLDRLVLLPIETVRLLGDWQPGLSRSAQALPAGAESAAVVVFYILEQIEQGEAYWRAAAQGQELNRLIMVAYEVAELAVERLRGLLQRAQASTMAEGDQWVPNLYKQLIKLCVSGVATAQLCRHLPELVVDILNQQWRAQPRQARPGHYTPHWAQLGQEEQFGLTADLRTEPPSIYSTPVWELLRYRAEIGIPFVADLVNYCTRTYQRHQAAHDPLVVTEFTTADGTVVRQHGNSELWAAYRGSGQLPVVLESVLMSMEKFFLEMPPAASPGESAPLNQWFNYLLTHAESVALSGVLASVAMARFTQLEGQWSPLVSVREFLEWDASRVVAEYMPHSLLGVNKSLVARRERTASNKLPHRLGFQRGLGSFVAHYLLQQGEFTPQLLAILDSHDAALTETTSLYWRKLLIETDPRKWKVTVDEEQQLASIQPDYGGPVQAMLTADEPERAAESLRLHMSSQIGDFLDGKEGAAWGIDTWLSMYAAYTRPGREASTDYRMAGLALLGLRHFRSSLDPKHIRWCRSTICSCLEFKLETIHHYETAHMWEERFSLFDEPHLLQSFALLYGSAADELARQEVVLLLLRTVSAPLPEHKQVHLFAHLRETFFPQYPDLLPVVWAVLLEYARQVMRAREAGEYRRTNDAEYEAAKTAALTPLLAGPVPTIVLDHLSPTTHDPSLLVSALELIPPTTQLPLFSGYITRLTTLMVQDLGRPKSPGYATRNEEERQFNIGQLFGIRGSLPRILLFSDIDQARGLLGQLLQGLNQQPATHYAAGDDMQEFVGAILAQVIRELDTLVAAPADARSTARTLHFWQLWEHLLAQLPTPATAPLVPLALLDIAWKPTATHWQPLDRGQAYYRRAMQQVGATHLHSLLKVLSTVGDKSLLPDALLVVVAICQNHPAQLLALFQTGPATAFIERLLQHHMRRIKTSPELFNGFMWLLDKMVDFGSPTAYLVREDAVTFKNQ
jgi:hypothetical protein